ncbi:hypothetical protein ABBQ38_001389 [Trebouxia sp. C0009 RCD-2024]
MYATMSTGHGMHAALVPLVQAVLVPGLLNAKFKTSAARENAPLYWMTLNAQHQVTVAMATLAVKVADAPCLCPLMATAQAQGTVLSTMLVVRLKPVK